MVLGSNSPAVLLFFSICFPFHYYPINLYLSCISLSDSRSTFLSAFLHFFSLFTIRIILFLNFHILVPNCQVFILENCWTGQNILGHDYKRKRGELRSTDLWIPHLLTSALFIFIIFLKSYGYLSFLSFTFLLNFFSFYFLLFNFKFQFLLILFYFLFIFIILHMIESLWNQISCFSQLTSGLLSFLLLFIIFFEILFCLTFLQSSY